MVQQVAGLFRDVDQPYRQLLDLHFTRLDLGEIENVIDDFQQGKRRFADQIDHFQLVVPEAGLAQHVDHANHAVHGRANLVAHIGEKDRFSVVGPVRLLPGLFQIGGACGDLFFQFFSELTQRRLCLQIALCKRDIVGQLRQQRHLFFMKEIDFGRVKRERADDVLREDQRQYSHRVDPRLGVLLAE